MKEETMKPVYVRNVLYSVFMTIFVSVWTVEASMCPLKPCNTCESNCPPLLTQRNEYVDCAEKLTLSRSTYVSDATLDCKMTACAQRLLRSACGFLPSPVPQDRHTLLMKLDDILEEEQIRKKEFDMKSAQLEEDVTPEERTYYNEATESFLVITRKFLGALATRAQAFRQTEYMASGAYRDAQKEVTKLRLENDARHAHVAYWDQWNQTLSNGVHTSPLALQRLHNKIAEELKLLEEEVALIDALQLKGLSKEQRIMFIYHLNALMSAQLHRIFTQTAQLRQELSFLQQGHIDLLTMLNRVLDDVRKNHSIVQCGALALSDMVTDTIVESTSAVIT